MRRGSERTCVHCGEVFRAEPRNRWHQQYCGAAPCKAASKKASQAKWLGKPENVNYFRGAEAVARVQAWRQAHPGYSQRPPERPAGGPIQQALAVVSGFIRPPISHDIF